MYQASPDDATLGNVFQHSKSRHFFEPLSLTLVGVLTGRTRVVEVGSTFEVQRKVVPF